MRETVEEAAPTADRSTDARWWVAVDLAVVIGLAVIGYLVRRDGLPVDGLFFDDAWVVAGAVHGRVGDLFMVGSAHPGFTLLLKAWGQIGGGGLRTFAYPALIVGTAGAPLLYLGLRRLRFARAICFLMAAVLVVSDVHIIYSGRVKSYTLDTALVIVILAALPALARATWRWPLAVGWVVAAVAAGTFSGYLLLATAVAMFVLVLHASSDRAVRVGALAVQGILQLGLYLAERRTTDLDEIERSMEDLYDGHLSLDRNPGSSVREIFKHLDRIADVYPGGSGRWLSVVAVVAIGGLVAGALSRRRRDEALVARYCLLLIVIAFVGGVLHRFPFGPATRNSPLLAGSTGGRHVLWMLPCIALGLALVLRRVRDALGSDLRRLFDGLFVVVALVVVVQQFDPAPSYLQPGSASATAYIDSHVRPDDAVIVLDERVYLFAVSTDEPLRLRPTPEHMIGFTPSFEGRTVGLGRWSERPASPEEIRRHVDDVERVLVYGALLGPASVEQVAPALVAEGFVERDKVVHGNEVIAIWTRRR
jgi:hypothetical protein